MNPLNLTNIHSKWTSQNQLPLCFLLMAQIAESLLIQHMRPLLSIQKASNLGKDCSNNVLTTLPNSSLYSNISKHTYIRFTILKYNTVAQNTSMATSILQKKTKTKNLSPWYYLCKNLVDNWIQGRISRLAHKLVLQNNLL